MVTGMWRLLNPRPYFQSIEVIDDQFDEPTSFSKKFTEEEIREQKMEHYLHLKEELKDYLED